MTRDHTAGEIIALREALESGPTGTDMDDYYGNLVKALYDQAAVFESYAGDLAGVTPQDMNVKIVAALVEVLVLIASTRNVVSPDELLEAVKSESDRWSEKDAAS